MTNGHELFLSRRGFMAGAGTLAIAPPAPISVNRRGTLTPYRRAMLTPY